MHIYNLIRKTFPFFISFLLLGFNVQAQDTTYAREIMMKLGSKEFGGRGYVGNGNLLAAEYIAYQYELSGLKYFKKSYLQKFNIPINSIPKLDYVVIDSDTLIAGNNYYISNASNSLDGTFDLVFVNDSLFTFDHDYLQQILSMPNLSKSILVFRKPNHQVRYQFSSKVAGLIFSHEKKLSAWSFSHAQNPVDYAILDVLSNKIPSKAKQITIKFKSEFNPAYTTQNVVGYIPGKKHPETFIIIGAHYDHMGMMGQDVIFPGGNDNTSGVAMMLNLAKYFSKSENQLDYSIVFIAFGGEEVGILGSTYFVKNPMFNLKKTKIMINLDMVGTGSKGIVVVNATLFKKQFSKLEKMNRQNEYLARVKPRGESCNSDHCPFSTHGVPSFFIYTTGDEYSEYHSPADLPERVPLTKYNEVFKLLRDYIQTY